MHTVHLLHANWKRTVGGMWALKMRIGSLNLALTLSASVWSALTSGPTRSNAAADCSYNTTLARPWELQERNRPSITL